MADPFVKKENVSQEEYEQILQHVFDDSNHSFYLEEEEETNNNMIMTRANHLDVRETESVCVKSNSNNVQLPKQETSQAQSQSQSHPQTKQTGKQIVIELSSDNE
jgi:hypothetical protein